MISHLHCSQAARRQLLRQIPSSNDPEYLRRMAAVHQYPAWKIIGIAMLGVVIVFLCSVAT